MISLLFSLTFLVPDCGAISKIVHVGSILGLIAVGLAAFQSRLKK